MVEFTSSKSKVGPVTERYVGGEFVSVDSENADGVKRMAVLGLDNSHNRDYKVAYASDPLVTVQGGAGVSHDELRESLEELSMWSLVEFTPIEIPHGEEWRCGFKTTPDRVGMIELMYEACERRVADYELLGDVESFSVYW